MPTRKNKKITDNAVNNAVIKAAEKIHAEQKKAAAPKKIAAEKKEPAAPVKFVDPLNPDPDNTISSAQLGEWIKANRAAARAAVLEPGQPVYAIKRLMMKK